MSSFKSIEHFTIPDIYSTPYDKMLTDMFSLFSGDTRKIPKKFTDIYNDRVTRLGVDELLKDVSRDEIDNFIRNFEKHPKDLSDKDINIKIELLNILIKGSVSFLEIVKKEYISRISGSRQNDDGKADATLFLEEATIGVKMLLNMILIGTQYELFKRKTLKKAKKSVKSKKSVIENFSQEEEIEVLLSLKACEEKLKSSVSIACPESDSSSLTPYIVGLVVMCVIIIILSIMLAM
jgi:hypothetical protein